jgi:putative ABC transport system permease protein
VVGRTLRRKILRDLLGMKGQVTAIALIIACGVASYVCVLSAYRGLKGSRDAYYARYRMPDVFAYCEKAPLAAADRLRAVPGVRAVRPRIVFEVTIDLPEIPSPCTGRILSLPDDGRRVVGDVHLSRGRVFEGDGDRQVIVGERFAEEHGLEIGDRLRVIMNNRKEALRIVGIAIAPEFVYLIRGSGDILPDPVHYTVLWVSTTFAESVFAYEDAFNEAVATLEHDAVGPDVIEAIDRILDPYGGIGAYLREDHPSHRYLDEEIKGLEGSAKFTPTIFLGVAAFVLHVLMGRLVRTQRTQIAVLRAFGFSTARLVGYVLGLVLLIGAIGAALGTAVGLWFARSMVEMYGEFYSFPVLRIGNDPSIVVTAVAVSLGFAVLGAISAAIQVARLRPAEGMRPEAPRSFHRTWIERRGWLWARLGFVWRMVVRGIGRARLRTAVTVLGVSLSASILVLGYFTEDSLDELMDFQYGSVDRQDARVAFNAYRGIDALREVRRLPGVRSAEPELMVPVKLRNGWREKRAALQGLDRETTLRGLVDLKRGEVPLPSDGLMLSSKLAELLALDLGDEVAVEVLDGEKARLRVTVSALVDEYIGTSAYVDRGLLSRWIGEEDAMTSALLRVDEARTDALDRELKRLPAVESVSFTSQVRENFEETLSASMAIMTGVLKVFAGIIAFGVIYNAARISLEIRRRELASLRVLGFTKREVAAILWREGVLISLFAIPIGLAIGYGFCLAMSELYDTDLYRFPVVFTARTAVLTTLWVLGFTLTAGLLVGRKVGRLDLVEVLKARE